MQWPHRHHGTEANTELDFRVRMTHTHRAMMSLLGHTPPVRLQRLQDVLRGLPENASANAMRDGVFQAELSDPSYTFHFVFSQGTVAIVEGKHASPAATVTMSCETFLQMACGQLDTRNVATFGDRGFAMKVFMFLNQPSESVVAGYRRTEHLAGRSPRHRAIERTSSFTRDHLSDALQGSRPVIYSGAISDEQLGAWSPATLMSTHGHVDTEALGARVPMRRLLGDLMDDGGVRNAGAPVPPELLRYVPTVPFLKTSESLVPRLWIAAAGLFTGLHRDPVHGLLAHYHGIKELTLYSPDQAKYLYPYERFRGYQPCCVYDVERPNLDAFPLFAQAEPLRGTLHPGEILLIPHGWFHFIKSRTLTVSVSIPGPAQADAPA